MICRHWVYKDEPECQAHSRCPCTFNCNKIYITRCFPGGSEGKESACNGGDLGSTLGGGEIPWRRKWQPAPVFLLGKSPGTEEPDGLQSMGLQRVGHDWSTNRVPIELTKIFICSHLSLFPLMIMVFVLSLEIFPTLRL